MENSDLNQTNTPNAVLQTAPKQRHSARWLTLVIAVLVAGGASAWWLMDNDKQVQAAPNASVEITSEGFVPQTIRIKKGSTITWTNNDAQPHQTASDPKNVESALNSEEPLTQGDSYAATFDDAGTFTYHDELNPVSLRATVVVE